MARTLYLLDTDHASLIQREGADGLRIRARSASVPPEQIVLSIVTYEEQVRGRLAEIARARTAADEKPRYANLGQMLELYCLTRILPFDDAALAIYDNLLRQRLGVGTMDLKIAAIALANNATLLTRNLSDFSKVPGLRIEDWSA